MRLCCLPSLGFLSARRQRPPLLIQRGKLRRSRKPQPNYCVGTNERSSERDCSHYPWRRARLLVSKSCPSPPSASLLEGLNELGRRRSSCQQSPRSLSGALLLPGNTK